MRISRWAAFPIAIGAIMASGAAFMAVRQATLATAGGVAMGEVVALEPSRGSRGGTVYRPIVRFAAPQGEVTIAGEIASSPPAHRVGDLVPVLYDPDRPSAAAIDTFGERWFTPVVLGSLGLVTMAVGIFTLWLAGRTRRAT